MADKPTYLSFDQIRSLLHTEPKAEIEAFDSAFGPTIDRSTLLLYRIQQESAQQSAKWATTLRNDAFYHFLHIAFQGLLTALFLFRRGLPIPGGNMMRQYAEAVAMALLCADPQSGVLESYLADRKHYPYHKSLDRVLKQEISKALQKLIGFDVKAWRRFVEIAKFYNYHSHTSIVALGFSFRTEDNLKVLGPDFDPAKVHMYKADFRRLETGLQSFRALSRSLHEIAERKERTSG